MSTDIPRTGTPNGSVSAGYRHIPLEPAFGPPAGQGWVRVNGRLALFRRAVIACYAVPAVVLAAFVGARVAGAPGLVLGIVLVCAVTALGWLLADRDARTWCYAEGAHELTIAHGVVVRRLAVIPYGRMQFADVSETLLEKLFGLATLRVHTAASAHSYIPGLPADQAVRLRDRIARRAEQTSMGL